MTSHRALEAEFRETIHSVLVMTDYQENQREKAALAIEYYDAIQEITEALEGYEPCYRTNGQIGSCSTIPLVGTRGES